MLNQPSGLGQNKLNLHVSVFVSVFVCHPNGFERPKRLLSERHHCIFSRERGHTVWTDIQVEGMADKENVD